MKTVKELIDAVLRFYFGNFFEPEILSKNPNLAIGYRNFVRILCDPEKPFYSSSRTIREKWKLLHDLGYLRVINQYSSKIVMSQVIEDFYPDAAVPSEEESE